MRSMRMTLAAALLLLALVPAWSADIAALTKQLREGDAKARVEARAQLLLEGLPALTPLLDLVGSENRTTDREAQVALVKLVMDLARPDVAAERRGEMVATLAARAKEGTPAQRTLAVFLLGQAGDARAVEALAPLLKDAALREDARRALTLIPGPEATQALLAELPAAEPAVKVAILGSLGRRQATETLKDVTAATRDQAPEVRVAAIAALGEMATPDAEKVLRDLRKSKDAAERSAARVAYLNLAYALASGATSGQARAMLERANKEADTETERAGALVGLTRLPEPPLGDLVKALVSGSQTVKGAVADGLVGTKAPGVTDALIKALGKAKGEAKVAWLRVLEQRGDTAAAAPVAAEVDDKDPAVRTAALSALGRLGAASDVARIAAALADTDANVKRAARDVLRQMQGTPVTNEIARLAAAGAPEARKPLLDALGDRRDPSAIDTLLAAAKDADEGVAMAALKSLGKVNYSYTEAARVSAAADAMLAVMKGGSEDLKVPAAWACARMAAGLRRVDPKRALAVYKDALTAAPGDDERVLALDGIGRFGDPATLDLIRPLMDKPELRASACAAVVPIADVFVKEGKRDEAVALYVASIKGLKDRDLMRDVAGKLRALGQEVDMAGEAGYLTRWFVLGPFAGRKAHEEKDVIDPAARVNTALPVSVEGKSYSWKYVELDDPSGLLDMERAIARQDNVVGYAYCEVRCDAAQDLVFHLGSDDSFVCWVNGKKAAEFLGDRAYAPDQNKFEVRLEPGRNGILVRVGQGGAQWSVGLQVTDKEGKPVRLAQKSDLDQSGEQGVLTTWWLLGPFEGAEATKEKDAIATDKAVDTAVALGEGDKALRWRVGRAVRAGGMVDLNRSIAQGNDRAGYAYAEVECAKETDAVLQIGSDDGVICWLNGRKVHEFIGPRAYAPDQDQVKVKLNAGKNTLLFKVIQGAGDWALGVRLTDAEGTPFVVTQKARGVFTAAAGEQEQVQAKRSILYYTLCTGFKHDQIPYSKGVLRELGREGGAFRVTVCEDASKITPRFLAQFDAIVMNTTGQPFPTPESKQALLDFVRGGKGVIGIHSATDTHYDWPDFAEMLGAWFDGHPWNQQVGFKIDDPKHVSTRMIPADWKVPDEIYQFRQWDRAKCHMLLSIDNATVDVTKQGVKRADKDFAVAWTKEFGKGKVFYTSLGHTRQVWDSPIFRQHLRAGILWTMGDAE